MCDDLKDIWLDYRVSLQNVLHPKLDGNSVYEEQILCYSISTNQFFATVIGRRLIVPSYKSMVGV